VQDDKTQSGKTKSLVHFGEETTLEVTIMEDLHWNNVYETNNVLLSTIMPIQHWTMLHSAVDWIESNR
jgi:hypothetical protein